MKRAVALLGMMSFAPLISANESPLNVATTIGMIADVAQEIGGQCVEVEAMMGPGVDPHLYQANASDVAMLRQAEQILYAGYSLEGQLGAVLENFSHNKPTLAVGPSGIDPAELMTSQDVYGIDPHLWMDVSLWAQTIPAISDAFTAARPECQASIETNAAKYEEQLNALHAWVAESIESIPERRRILVTAHDAFGYYGRAYGIEVEGIQGISTQTETGIADIRSMTDVVVEREVPAIFVESTINPRTIQAVIEAARQRGHEVAIGGELYSDAMGDANSADGTYIGMIYANTRHIVEALGGSLAPMPDALSEWAGRWEIAE
ncbi:metal ABC transporter solute-binding protein, Zn/Mn family [Vreelandella profundi]|uniref:metal ABC transporter solute-binding protein, Zn/Mn family n=1 Tax=Vreelandella profundi TaxID=2852117 RepID=UPI001EF15998|nr:zinc ABC transporter substrate-binding protein [Halomonas profundi]